MKKAIIKLTIIFSFLFILSFGLYMYLHIEIFKTLSITFGVTSYHFIMRLITGVGLDLILKNNIDGNGKWFREKPVENKIYKLLKVKKWKKHMPTYNKEYFDIKKHTAEEIIAASCQAEIIHEIIIVLSFLPISLCLWFDPDAVFIITSVLAAVFDSFFVIMQRYNRPRLIKIIKRRY